MTMRFIALVAVGLSCLAQPNSARAGGAFAVDDAGIGAVGDCQIETWVSADNANTRLVVFQPACVADLGTPVELTASFQRIDVGDEASLVGGQAKFQLATSRLDTAVALSVGTVYDASVGDQVLTYLNVPITISVTEAFRINVNSGVAYDGVVRDIACTWGGGIELDATETVTLIGEVYGFAGIGLDRPRFQAGLRFKPSESVDLDIIAGHNIDGAEAEWLTTGLSVRF